MTNPTAEPAGDPMLTVAEVCKQLGIGRTKYYDLVRKGELVAVNVNPGPKRLVGQPGPRRSIRVRQSVVDAFEERNKVPA